MPSGMVREAMRFPGDETQTGLHLRQERPEPPGSSESSVKKRNLHKGTMHEVKTDSDRL